MLDTPNAVGEQAPVTDTGASVCIMFRVPPDLCRLLQLQANSDCFQIELAMTMHLFSQSISKSPKRLIVG